ncbi:MAG: DUF4388 domain-containing protein [Thermomicrobiales bacterium]
MTTSMLSPATPIQQSSGRSRLASFLQTSTSVPLRSAPRDDGGFSNLRPFVPAETPVSTSAPPAVRELQQVRSISGGTEMLRRHRQTSYLSGMSLFSVLQMLHLDRKTCVVDVCSGRNSGSLTFVHGDLVDAKTGMASGEAAAYEVLGWPEPEVVILDGVKRHRQTVSESFDRLLMQAVRMQDERESQSDGAAEDAADQTAASGRHDWAWLVETLVISGATAAAVVDVSRELVLAAADERQGQAAERGESRIDDLIPLTHGARLWSRLIGPAVDEMIVRLSGELVFIRPVDASLRLYVFATLPSMEAVDMVRSAIRTLEK